MEEQRIQVQALLNELREGHCPQTPNESMESSTDKSLNLLNYLDFPKLRRARAKLAVKSKDPKLDATFRWCITSMVGTLNLYLDPELQYTWQEASLVAAKSMGTGIKDGSKRARNIHTWIHNYLARDRLLTHCHGQHSKSILDHEDFAQDIQLHLMEIAKNGYICAQDVVDYVATPKIQEKLGSKSHTISVQTARRWLKWLNWRYGKKPNGMYVDGHEREDVVQY